MAEDSDTLVPFLLGGLLGCVAGLLLAPKPGKETREDLLAWFDPGEHGALIGRAGGDASHGRRDGHRRGSHR